MLFQLIMKKYSLIKKYTTPKSIESLLIIRKLHFPEPTVAIIFPAEPPASVPVSLHEVRKQQGRNSIKASHSSLSVETADDKGRLAVERSPGRALSSRSQVLALRHIRFPPSIHAYGSRSIDMSALCNIILSRTCKQLSNCRPFSRSFANLSLSLSRIRQVDAFTYRCSACRSHFI